MDNPFRLPRRVAPTRYDVLLEPDLTRASFSGHVSIRLDVHEATDTLVCNAADIVVASAKVRTADALLTGTVKLDEPTERCTITLPTTVGPGQVTVEMVFTGTLNDKLRGWYRSTYIDESGAEQVIATTQMQATDCRRAFPCWDEPDLKAVFSVTLVIDPSLMAISNGPEVSREAVPNGKVAIRFADTMVMSTYLVAFVVGRLEATEPIDVGGVPMRVVHVPGRGHLTSFALEIGSFALRWFQDYYGIAYPSEKVDLVALPDFAAGAMENLGCITFRESLLLVDPATATQAEEQHVADVVAHELAHMWFGDLVTMRWWNGIWLNEAFATFMEVAACDAFRPSWHRWTTFSVERTVAFETDSLVATRPVEFEVVSPADAEGMFDILTYVKGGALLRMLQQYLGEDRFRDGVRNYLRTHSYGNTDTGDLWDAMVTVSGEPARQIMDSWIWQGGFPIVIANVDGDDLVLTQHRFLFDATSDAGAASRWSIPIHIRQLASGAHDGDTTTATAIGAAAREDKVLLDGDTVRVPLLDADATVVVNAWAAGFFRVGYSPELLARLTGPVLATLSTPERYALVEDTWASVLAGATPAEHFCQLALRFEGERDLQVWQQLLQGLRFCDRLIDDDARARFQSFVRTLVAPPMATFGWTPAPGEDDLVGELRGQIIRASGILGADPTTIDECRRVVAKANGGSSGVAPAVAAAAAAVVAAHGSDADYGVYVERYRNAATPQDRERYLHLLAEFPTEAQMDRTIGFAFTAEVKSQDAPFLLGYCLANRRNGPRAWQAVRSRWREANEQFPSNTIRVLAAGARWLMTPEAGADVAAFFAEHPIPQATKTLEQILERQRVNVALREREHERLSASF